MSMAIAYRGAAIPMIGDSRAMISTGDIGLLSLNVTADPYAITGDSLATPGWSPGCAGA